MNFNGMDRQLAIYQDGLMGSRLSVPVSLPLLEQKAKETLTPQAYDYVAGGAGGEQTMRANREAFARWQIVPRMPRDVVLTFLADLDLTLALSGYTCFRELSPAALVREGF